jgi:predicted O-methyltransferase YrrM
VDDTLRTLLDKLYAEGQAFDADEPDRRQRRRNLSPDAAELLALTLRIAGARDVVEIGTSNGYSAIWLADAVRDTGGSVVSVDVEASVEAVTNVRHAGLSGRVRFEIADGGEFLARQPADSVDLLFLDAERTAYPGWWPHPQRVLRPGAVLAIDNVLSHPHEVAPFLALLESFTGTTVAIGKGLYLGLHG